MSGGSAASSDPQWPLHDASCQGCCTDEDKSDSGQSPHELLEWQPVTFDLGSPGRGPLSPLTSKLPQSSSSHLSAALLSSAVSLFSCVSQWPEVMGVAATGVGVGAGGPGEQRLTEFPHAGPQESLGTGQRLLGVWVAHERTRPYPIPMSSSPPRGSHITATAC